MAEARRAYAFVSADERVFVIAHALTSYITLGGLGERLYAYMDDARICCVGPLLAGKSTRDLTYVSRNF